MGSVSDLQAIVYERGTLSLLDQRVIPYEKTYLPIKDCDAGWTAINSMAVRGAPAIAIAGALSLAVELNNMTLPSDASTTLAHINDRLKYLVTSRPTAVNLSIAAQQLTDVATKAAALPDATPQSVATAVIEMAEEIMREDTAGNLRMGAFGSEAMQSVVKRVRGKSGKVSATHTREHASTLPSIDPIRPVPRPRRARADNSPRPKTSSRSLRTATRARWQRPPSAQPSASCASYTRTASLSGLTPRRRAPTWRAPA